MSESLFQRLYREENSAVMNLNYRMNARITALANEITYNGELLIGSDDVAKATLKIPNKEVNSFKLYLFIFYCRPSNNN